jgi:hypothetical protein
MKKAWIIIGSFALIFIIIQFFRPEKNITVKNPKDDIVFQMDVPIPVKKKIVDACYDCHSDRTAYPIYNRIAPVSWILAHDIKEGKSHLNFSEWASYDKKKQIKLLNDICDVITEGEMPLKSYVFMHSRAIINDKEREDICKWIDIASDQIMKSGN